MSINITSSGSISHNPALDVKSPAIEPITEPRSLKRDAHGRFTSSEVTNLDSAPKDVKKQILENNRRLHERDALKEGAPFLWSIIEQNRILSDARKYNQLADAVYLGRGEDAYYLFKFGKGSASGTIFGFHYNCGNLEDVVTHAEAVKMLNYMEHYDNIQKFTF